MALTNEMLDYLREMYGVNTYQTIIRLIQKGYHMEKIIKSLWSGKNLVSNNVFLNNDYSGAVSEDHQKTK